MAIIKQNEYFFEQAGKEAEKALCLKAKCGTVIVLNGEIIGRGYNAPPGDDTTQRRCGEVFGASSKPKSDRTCCVHAEWRAILDAIRNKKDISSSTLYFTRVDDSGNLLMSGKPYCTVCSRLALDSGIKYFGLWHEEGIKLYDTKEYNSLSYDFHKNL
jgi:deoxycytidylate deaminase